MPTHAESIRKYQCGQDQHLCPVSVYLDWALVLKVHHFMNYNEYVPYY